MMTPADFATDFIFHWEDGQSRDPNRTHSLNPGDAGNWTGARVNVGQLVGSNHGVTPAVLAEFRGVPLVTKDQMHALTLNEAAQIAIAKFYRAPHLDLLDWNQVTASVFDMGWGAGPVQAMKLLQRMIAVGDDGQCGPFTARAYHEWLDHHGLETAAQAYGAARNAFYDQIIAARPQNAQFRQGWRNRTAYYLPGSPWWGTFVGKAAA
jgi:lysozyme family protein